MNNLNKQEIKELKKLQRRLKRKNIVLTLEETYDACEGHYEYLKDTIRTVDWGGAIMFPGLDYTYLFRTKEELEDLIEYIKN